jgi:hypothetical protein
MARPLTSPAAALLLAASLGGLACVGAIDVPGGSQPGNPGDPNKPDPGGRMPANPGNPTAPGLPGAPTGPIDPDAAGPQPLRRLDQREYNNTVRDLLGDTSRPADKFPSDRDTEFTFRHPGLVSSQDYSTIQDAAEALAAAAEKNVGTLAPCAAGAAEATCARDFATSFGLRAYRRPLVAREIDSLIKLYNDSRGASPMVTYAGGIRAMIEGILQSPAFIYHWESGPAAPAVEGKVVRLDHYENASRLSYFIWGSMPDGPLFEAAAAQKLGTAAELESHARRLLADARARETVSDFVEQWLGLDQVADRPKDPKAYPEFKDDLKAAMLAEARTFVSNVVFDGDGKLGTLLTAGFSFLNQPLAPVYGISGAQGMELKQTNLDPNQRAGLLTQAAFLTVTGATDGSHPVKRGKKVFERLLCGELPPPPADVPPPKPASEGGTTRERFAEHGTNACAISCHENMDPLGFAFENYDGIGRWRTMDNGGKVDAAGVVTLDGQKQSFKDARELVRLLAASETVNRCFATQWARFAFRRFETDGDRGSLQAIGAAFGKDGHNIRDLLVGVATSRSFRYRAPSQGEILQ